MPNCRNCGARITKFDKDICPVCGQKNPLMGVDVVKSVEVTNTGHAVLLEHVGMELDHIARLRSESNHVDTTSESLEADLRTDNATEFVHHVECVFTAVLIESLETGATTCFEVGDASLHGCFNGRHEVLHEHASAEDAAILVRQSTG